VKYVVLKDFTDRFDGGRYCRPGEPHTPPNKERADQLIQLGFIKAVPEAQAPSSEKESEDKPKADDEVTDGTPKKRGRKKKDADVKTDGDSDGEAPTDE